MYRAVVAQQETARKLFSFAVLFGLGRRPFSGWMRIIRWLNVLVSVAGRLGDAIDQHGLTGLCGRSQLMQQHSDAPVFDGLIKSRAPERGCQRMTSPPTASGWVFCLLSHGN